MGRPINNREGEVFLTKEGYEVEIIKYFGAHNCTIKFNDVKETILDNIRYDHLKDGSVSNPYHLSVLNIGYFGIGDFTSRDNISSDEKAYYYTAWINMLKRGYCKKYQESFPTYTGCSVDESWHNFQNFAKWYVSNYKNGWHLDKDLLFKNNKIYSPETCCFVPQEINNLLTKRQNKRGNLPIGVLKYGKKFITQCCSSNKTKHVGSFNTPEEAFQAYKVAKENYIKEVANKWQNKIEPRAYQALINYQVKIDD